MENNEFNPSTCPRPPMLPRFGRACRACARTRALQMTIARSQPFASILPDQNRKRRLQAPRRGKPQSEVDRRTARERGSRNTAARARPIAHGKHAAQSRQRVQTARSLMTRLVGSDEDSLRADAEELANLLPKAKVGSVSNPVSSNAGISDVRKTFKEADIDRMPLKEFQRRETEIMQAYKEGRVTK